MPKRAKKIPCPTPVEIPPRFIRAESVARLVLVVEYSSVPDRGDLDEVLDKARELGGVELARFETLNPICEDLV